MVWILFDTSRAVPSPSSGSSGDVAAAIRRSTNARPVMVEFYADWCGPCRIVGPLVEEFANDMRGKAEVLRVNVDDNQALAQEYSVRSIPSFIVFKGGRAVARETGVISKSQMRTMLGF